MQAEVAARSILAPQYIEPGADGDALGVEGRHRHNMQKLFGYLAHMEKVANDHADHIDGMAFEHCGFKRSMRDMAMGVKSAKSQLVQSDDEFKLLAGIVEANDTKLKLDFAASVQGIWGFLEANNVGIMKLV